MDENEMKWDEENENQEIKMSGKKKAAIIIGCVAAVALIGAVVWFVFLRGGASSDNVVSVSKISTIMDANSGMQQRYMGVVESQKTWNVQLKEGETVKELKVKQGDTVSVGTALFSYDTTKMESDLAQAELDLDRTQNDIDNQNSQIKTLQQEKKNASKDRQLEYTVQIQAAQTDIKKNEYEKKSKAEEIKQLKEKIQNATVKSQIAGVVQSINESGTSGDGTALPYITVLQTGAYRVKGMVNEQNIQAVTEGEKVIIRSRVDDKTWTGTMGKVDTDRASANNADNTNTGMSMGGNDTTQSSSYPFYVTLDSSDGLILGQHVYIEPDQGQSEVPTNGIWIGEYFINDIDTSPYVWADNGKGKLEKRSVTLGDYKEELMLYEITGGLTKDDAITYPEESLEQGLPTEISSSGEMGMGTAAQEQEAGGSSLGEEGGMQVENGAATGGTQKAGEMP